MAKLLYFIVILCFCASVYIQEAGGESPNFCKWPVYGFEGSPLNEELCGENGICHNTERGAHCRCHEEYTGMLCQEKVGERDNTTQIMSNETTTSSSPNTATTTTLSDATTTTTIEVTTMGPQEYVKIAEKKTWQDAENDCINRSGHLPCIYNEEQNKLLLKFYINERQWLGAKATWNKPPGGEHNFTWVDTGTPISATGYTNWRSGEPNNPLELCMNTITAYDYDAEQPGVEKLKWNDEPCEAKYHFICVIQH